MTRRPDAVFLDLQLGETDGVEQLRFLSVKGYDSPLVLMSGYDCRVLATTEQLARKIGLKPIAALSKPVRADELRTVLRRIRQLALPLSEARLLEAIHGDELALEYQPIVSGDRTKVRWLEALVRWQHPDRGRLSPDLFIPIAERSTEVIGALTEWVVRAAAKQCGCLRAIGIRAPMAINVSGRNLHHIAFADLVDTCVRDAGVSPGDFSIELTETAAALDPVMTMDILTRLRLKGFHLELDDFGTGYSSLKQLRQLPFSALKVDRSFVADVVTSRDSFAIVKSTIDLAHNLELESVAEGVETEDIAQCLVNLGADALQGYLIAPPLPAEQLAAWLQPRSTNRS